MHKLHSSALLHYATYSLDACRGITSSFVQWPSQAQPHKGSGVGAVPALLAASSGMQMTEVICSSRLSNQQCSRQFDAAASQRIFSDDSRVAFASSAELLALTNIKGYVTATCQSSHAFASPLYVSPDASLCSELHAEQCFGVAGRS